MKRILITKKILKEKKRREAKRRKTWSHVQFPELNQ